VITQGPATAPRPRLTATTLQRWVPPLIRAFPWLATAFLVPGRLPPRVREAAMLGVTSINRCAACSAVHGRWADRIGLDVDALRPDEASAYDFGQRLAVSGGREITSPAGLSPRHARELRASAILMELANLAGNRFLAPAPAATGLQVADVRTARLLDLLMRAADRAGVRHARRRIAGSASGDVLEIGIGTGSNLGMYADTVVLHALDPSAPARAIARRRARRTGRVVVLVEGDAEALPYPDASFDAVVATFVLCSVGDVGRTLAEARRVLRPGGTLRLLEHARSRQRIVAATQARSAPAWGRATGGCRLDHDVVGAVRKAGLAILEERHHIGGLLVEVVAA
jgi:AhpD family alkylhydroperoxidase